MVIRPIETKIAIVKPTTSFLWAAKKFGLGDDGGGEDKLEELVGEFDGGVAELGLASAAGWSLSVGFSDAGCWV